MNHKTTFYVIASVVKQSLKIATPPAGGSR